MAPKPPAALPKVSVLLPLPKADVSAPAFTANGNCCLFAVRKDEKSAGGAWLDAAASVPDLPVSLVLSEAAGLFSD